MDEAPRITPIPTDFTVDIEVVAATPEPVVHVTWNLVTGIVHLWMPGAMATHIATMLHERGAIASRGILLPPGTVLPNSDHPEEN